MKKYVSKWLKAARMVHAQLVYSRHAHGAIALPTAAWQNIVRLVRQVDLAQRGGWRLAAQRQAKELLGELEWLQSSLTKCSDQLREHLAPPPIASQAELYQDLAALDREFQELLCDLESQSISVNTEPIELKGIHLGRFKIRLEIGQQAGPQEYHIVALEPNPASSDSNITHPHVNDESLCAGDGLRAIRSALATGRLYDFFSIVNQTLQTYAQGRAYVELENWTGMSCHGCGCTVDEDDRCACDRCEESLCSDCVNRCDDCGVFCCSNCSERCPRCSRIVCGGCLQACRQCGTDLCGECLTQNLCSQCQNHESELEDSCLENQPSSPNSSTAAF
jgi:hypothetical protein